jgi:hypothetical protein
VARDSGPPRHDYAQQYPPDDLRALICEAWRLALSQITENRKVEIRKSSTFQDPIFGFCLKKATLRQSPRRPAA